MGLEGNAFREIFSFGSCRKPPKSPWGWTSIYEKPSGNIAQYSSAAVVASFKLPSSTIEFTEPSWNVCRSTLDVKTRLFTGWVNSRNKIAWKL